jgi:hypothetical protein
MVYGWPSEVYAWLNCWPSVTQVWLNDWPSVKHARCIVGILHVFWMALFRARMVKWLALCKARMVLWLALCQACKV